MHATRSDGTSSQASARCEGARVLLEGALTMDTLPALLDSAREACKKSGVEAVDFAGVTSLDSAAIALALELRRVRGSALRFENLPDAVRKLARLYSVADQLGIDG